MLKEKVKSLIKKKTEGNNKKTIENLIVFLILLVISFFLSVPGFVRNTS